MGSFEVLGSDAEPFLMTEYPNVAQWARAEAFRDAVTLYANRPGVMDVRATQDLERLAMRWAFIIDRGEAPK